MKELVDLLSAFLTPLIAVIVTIIAYQQYLIKKNQLKLDLYEKRWKTYLTLRSLIANILVYNKWNEGYKKIFQEALLESIFLFGEHTHGIFNNVLGKYDELLKIDPKSERYPKEINEIIDWFTIQNETLYKHFEKYFKIAG